MSTRRSTRAASRQASSVGAASAIGAADIPSSPPPRRTARRAGGGPLPTVALRPSTAYGTNTLPQPSRMSGPLVSDQVTDVLNNLLNPNPLNLAPKPAAASHLQTPASASRSNSRTPSTSGQRSFMDESNIFGDANVDSSVVDSEDPLLIPEAVEERLREDRAHLENLASERLSTAHAARSPNTKTYKAMSLLQVFWSWTKSLRLPFIKYATLLSIALVALTALTLFLMAYSKLFFTSGSLNPFVPSGNQTEIQSIHQRLNVLEHEVRGIKLRFSQLDQHSIDRLKQLLPDHLLVKKDDDGNILLSDDFWKALQDKIRSDETLSSHDRGSASSDQQPVDRKGWERYITKNKATMDAYTKDQIRDAFPRLLKDNKIATKQEIIESIHSIWEEKKDEIMKDMSVLKKKLDAASDNIKKSRGGSGSLTKQEIATAVEDFLKKTIPKEQLQRLSQSSLDSASLGVVRLNHFSKGTGAVVNKQVTSPNYVLPANRVGFLTKLRRQIQNNAIPVANSPEAALTSWQEHGDCWCTPSEYRHDGSHASLGVMMGSNIYPEQVVVEHILPTAALEPGCTPKDMDLLAHVPDPELFELLKDLSEDMFGERDPGIPDGYVRVAEWQYDPSSPKYVQSFEIGLDMKAVGAHTSKLIVRAKTNWGGGLVPYTCFYRLRVHGDIMTRAKSV